MHENLNQIIDIPKWNQEDIASVNFSKIFISNFLDGIYIDLKGNNTYIFGLMDYIFLDYYKTKDLSKCENYFFKLKENNQFSEKYVDQFLSQIYTLEKDFEKAWEYSIRNPRIEDVCFFYFKLKRELLNGKLIINLVRKSTIKLTSFGKENISEIIPFVSEIYELYKNNHKDHIFEMPDFFIKNPCVIHSLSSTFKVIDDKIFRDPILQELNFMVYDSSINNKIDLIEKLFNEFIYEAENKFRVSKNLPKIGEGWISETELFYFIKEYFHKDIVIHNGHPTWLGKQHLDIYFPKYNIGIEYQGEQHYRPIGLFGGEEGFLKNIKRDEEKKIKCSINNCELIYVTKNYHLNELLKKIECIIEKKGN